jgi:hypothetical protein
VSQSLRREEKLAFAGSALAGGRVALVGAGAARRSPAAIGKSGGGVQVHTLPTVAA